MTPDRPTVLIIGAGYAGVLAANRAAGRLRGRARVVLVSDGDELVHRVRLHEVAAGRTRRRYPLAGLLHRRVERIRARVTAIDAAARRCTLDAGPGSSGELGARTLAYDVLVVAAGSGVAATAAGAREHAMALAGCDQALAFARRLTALPDGAPVVVVGGGLSAIELAAEVADAHRRLSVRLVCDALGAGWDAATRAIAIAELTSMGVRVEPGVRVAEVTRDAVVLDDGVRVASSATAWAAGFAASPLAADSGLGVDRHGRLLVGDDLRVPGHPEIVGCGDAVATPAACSTAGELRMGCVTAMPMGAHAADVVVDLVTGQAPTAFRFGFPGQCVSLGRRRGMVVRTDRADRDRGRVVAGLRAAVIKELICRYVIGAIRLERRLPGLYVWYDRRGRPREVPAATTPALPAGDNHAA
jgi:NADH:ubiquinone reductase (H+-translocating)